MDSKAILNTYRYFCSVYRSLVMSQTQKGPRRESLSEGFSLGGAARPFSQNLGKVPKRLEA
ncbi:unnamed protein product [Clonostachys solani]|uniref:Uncharacterized protein n=1 Tax=Clonostachys solani TaxID=160281 RepID=A0A9P0EIL4_9HYPO|nr:unnamed protein product [Clonostachys solani]